MTKKYFSAAGAFGAVALLAACGGGGTGDPVEAISSDPDDIVTSSVVAAGGDDLNNPASFPLYYSLNIPGDTQATVQRGTGLVEVLDASTIRVTLEEGDDPVTFTESGGQYVATVDGETLTLDFSEGSGGILAFLDNDFDTGGPGVSAIYGFETNVADLPSGTVSYTNAGAGRSWAYIATEDDPDVLALEQTSNPSLTVDFAGGTVTGTLFDGNALVDLADDGSADDTLNVTATIANGSISGGSIAGEVALSATVDVTGLGNVDLDPIVSASGVDGKVFGIDANVVGGTFEADTQYDIGEPDRLDGTIVGTFFAVESP